MARLSEEASVAMSHNIPICQNFTAKPGDGVNWTNIPPSGCTLTADDNDPWPFNVGPPVRLPSPAAVGIKSGLPAGEYYFIATCCAKPICVTVT
ncbi:MAG: hypothetical protein WA252_12290 [Candidatus Sulfotelmatobacter sp.]